MINFELAYEFDLGTFFEFDLGTCGTKYVCSVVRFQFYHRRLPNFDEQFPFIGRTNIHWRIADFSLLENVCL